MRRPRLELPGIPQHITHRGVNRGATFIVDGDFASYLQALEACSREQGVAIHGYVLMTNHVHLLAGAQASGGKRGQVHLSGGGAGARSPAPLACGAWAYTARHDAFSPCLCLVVAAVCARCLGCGASFRSATSAPVGRA